MGMQPCISITVGTVEGMLPRLGLPPSQKQAVGPRD